MAQDFRTWFALAEEQLSEARFTFSGGRYRVTAFLAHQVAESALKALWIRESDGLPPRTHNLIDLVDRLEAPEPVVPAAQRLNPLYRTSRYPDAANGNPARCFNQEIAGEALASAEEVHEWCSSRLPS